MNLEEIEYRHANECGWQDSAYKFDLPHTINEHIDITIQAVIDELINIKSILNETLTLKHLNIFKNIDEKIEYYQKLLK